MLGRIKYGKLAIYIVTCVGVGIVAAYFTQSSVNNWFRTLSKPWFNPPSWLFAPVWTALYVLMGVSAYLVSENDHSPKMRSALGWFYTQLILNFLWSFSFFYLRSPLLGLVNILLLWISIISMIIYFSKVSKLAAFLQIPYVIWVTFAALLNFSIWLLN